MRPKAEFFVGDGGSTPFTIYHAKVDKASLRALLSDSIAPFRTASGGLVFLSLKFE